MDNNNFIYMYGKDGNIDIWDEEFTKYVYISAYVSKSYSNDSWESVNIGLKRCTEQDFNRTNTTKEVFK